MRIEFDILPRAYLGVCWRYRCRMSRSTITSIEIKVGRFMWDRMRFTTDFARRERAVGAIDRLDIRPVNDCSSTNPCRVCRAYRAEARA